MTTTSIPESDGYCSQTIELPAVVVDQITDRQLADDLALAVQDLVDALTHLRWCFACRASNIGGGTRGGCRTCIAFLAGVKLIAKAKAVRS